MSQDVPIPGDVVSNQVTERRVEVFKNPHGRYEVTFGGHTVTCDALNMGCPVALCDGDTLEFGGIHRIQVAKTVSYDTEYVYLEVLN